MIDGIEVLIVGPEGATKAAALGNVFAQCCPGAHIRTASGPAQALDYLLARGEFEGRDDRSQPELVVLQARPPLAWALALLASIRRLAATSAVPVVVVTPHPDNDTLRRCYAAGANSVVAETGDLDAMVSAMGIVHAFWTGVNESLYLPAGSMDG